MLILISNDDGVYAPGLTALASSLAEVASVRVFAPDRNRSGASNSLTLDNPLRVKKLKNGFVSIEGTPTDCVHLALTGFLRQEEPDLVVSGINAGENLGDDVLYSGTVAAAREGRFLGLPAVAISLAGEANSEYRHYDTAAQFAKIFVDYLRDRPITNHRTVFNINVPDLPMTEIAGVEMTRLGTRLGAEPTIKQQDPRGHTIYWVGLPGPEEDAGPGTDFHAIRHNRISITPLQLDMTNENALKYLTVWAEDLHL